MVPCSWRKRLLPAVQHCKEVCVYGSEIVKQGGVCEGVGEKASGPLGRGERALAPGFSRGSLYIISTKRYCGKSCRWLVLLRGSGGWCCTLRSGLPGSEYFKWRGDRQWPSQQVVFLGARVAVLSSVARDCG